MKFTIYAKNKYGLHRLYRINRNATGLYFNNASSRADASYVTYHDSGAYWVRSGRSKIIKRRRPPLNELRGAYTLSIATNYIDPDTTPARPNESVQVREHDIVVEYLSGFCCEIILADDIVELEPLSSRSASHVFVKHQLSPIMILEFFTVASNIFPQQRFPSPPINESTFEHGESI
jgi:hypothetical protein